MYSGLLKQCRKGKVNPYVQFCVYSPDSDICIYRTLNEYINRTVSSRESERRIVISYVKPYKHVVSTYDCRWLKSVMKNYGIDVNKYTSHSTRSAISLKVKQIG